ncbi:MAG: hypothetical protein QXO17_06910 [Nitrososphaerota archaeon]
MWRRPGPAAAHLALLLALTAALVLLLWVQPVRAEGNIVSVTVTVLNGHNEVLQGANVTAYYTNETKVPNTGGMRGSAITNSSGRAVLQLMSGTTDAKYVIKVYFRGLLVNETQNEFDCSTECPRTSFSVKLDVYHLTIRVLSSSGVPVPGARVNVTSSLIDPQEIARNAQTDSSGNLVVRNLPAKYLTDSGELDVEYTIDVSYTAVGNVKLTKSVTHTLSSDRTSVEVRLDLYSISAKVQDMEGNSIQGVTVELLKGDSATPLLTETSDSNGLVTFKLLPGGTYSLRFKMDNELVYERRDLVVAGDVNLGDLTLPVKKLSFSLFSQNNRPVTGFQLSVKLIRTDDNSEYRSRTTSVDYVDFGYVRADRDYVVQVLFEGHKVYEGTLRGGDIRTNVRLTLNFGNFGISLNLEGLFGRLPQLLRDAVVLELTVDGGSYKMTPTRENEVFLAKDQPLVPYRYRLLYLGSVIGEETIRPQRNGDLLTVRPEVLDLNVKAVSLDGRPVPGTLILSVGNSEIGSVQLSAEGGAVKGLVPLKYGYRVVYRNVQVAEGELAENTVRQGQLAIRVRVLDLVVRVLDHDGEVPLEGALVTLQVGGYRDTRTANATGKVLFPDVPYSKANVTVRYMGVEVYGAEVEYLIEDKGFEISGTRVFRVHITALDGERSPLPGGRYRLEIGEFSAEGELDDRGNATVRLVPGGTVRVTIEFKGVQVRQSEERVDEQDERLQLVTRVFRRVVDVLYLDAEGNRRGLPGVKVEYRLKGSGALIEETATDERGRATVLLPASNYVVVYRFMDVEVGRSEINHAARIEEEVELPVYGVAYRVLDVEGTPVGNLTVTFLLIQQGKGARPLLTQRVGPSGEGSAVLPSGRYLIRLNSSSWSQEAGIDLTGPGSRNIALVPQRPVQGGAPYVVSVALVAVAALGILRSLSLTKAAGGPARRGTVEGGSSGRPEEEGGKTSFRRRVRRNL